MWIGFFMELSLVEICFCVGENWIVLCVSHEFGCGEDGFCYCNWIECVLEDTEIYLYECMFKFCV